MKLTLMIIVSVLLLSSSAQAALPQLNSLSIDEAQSTLTLFGAFSSTRGTVSIDSVNAAILAWSDSTIVCSIADSGRGNAGPVRVTTDHGASNILTISLWNCTIKGYLAHLYSLGSEYLVDTWHLHWRIWLNPEQTSFHFQGMSSSFDSGNYHLFLQDPDISKRPRVDDASYPPAIYSFSGNLDFKQRRVSLSKMQWRTNAMGYLNVEQTDLRLDSAWNIVAGAGYSNNSNGGAPMVWDNTPVEWAPSNALLVLRQVSAFSVSVSQNPVVGTSYLNISAPKGLNIRIEITNELGNMVWSSDFQLQDGRVDVPLNASHFAPGAYFYHVNSSAGSTSGKILVLPN